MDAQQALFYKLTWLRQRQILLLLLPVAVKPMMSRAACPANAAAAVGNVDDHAISAFSMGV